MKKSIANRMIKRVLLLISGLLTILILVLVIITIRFKSKQIQTAAIPKIEIPGDAVDHLSQAIRFETVSHEDSTLFDAIPFLGFCDFLVQTYPLTHATLERQLINNYSLLYKWNGKDPDRKPIILTAHYDVVPVEESTRDEWTEEPFGGRIDDQFIWGRGTMDDKLAVIGLMETVEMLIKDGFIPDRTIYLAFGHDEEIGGQNGAKMIIEHLRRNHVRAEYTLDEGLAITRNLIPGIEKDVALIGLSEKGFLTVKLSLTNEGGHASMPQKETTIDILANAIVKLRSNQPDARICETVERFIETIGPEMPLAQKIVFANRWLFKGLILNIYGSSPASNSLVRTTTAPTMFNSGIKANILPASASATLNFRILPGETVEDIMSHVKHVIDDERIVITMGKDSSNPSPVSSMESSGFKTINETIRQVFPAVIVSSSLVNGATDSRHYSEICDDVYRFGPLTMTAEDLTRTHGINERVSIQAFNNNCRFYYQLIKNADK